MGNNNTDALVSKCKKHPMEFDYYSLDFICREILFIYIECVSLILCERLCMLLLLLLLRVNSLSKALKCLYYSPA